MRNTINCIVFAVMLLFAAANVAAKAGFKGQGLKVGVNRANLVGDNADGTAIYGPILGGFLAFNLDKDLSIQAELLFTEKGTEGDTLGVASTATLRYLEFPVLLRGDGPKKGFFQPAAYVGAALSLRIDATGELGPEGGVRVGLEEETRSLDFGFVLGVIAAFDAGPGQVFLEGRYTRGIRSVAESAGDFQNSVFSLMIGYFFPDDE
jgi:hypothetical protein